MLLFAGSFLLPISLLQSTCPGQDQTQRPLPLPDQATGVPAASRQLLQKLRQTIEQQERAPVPPAALDQLGSMLKKLQEQLPPDVVPPGLGGLSPDALKKSLQQPETQQRMKELLQQFQSDGLLPPRSAEGSATTGPVPPLPVPKLTPESKESLKDFLEQLQRQAEPFQKLPETEQKTPGDPSAENLPETRPAPTSERAGSSAAPRGILRRRENSDNSGSRPRSRLQPPRPLPPADSDESKESVSESRGPRLRQPVPLPEQEGARTQPAPGARPEPDVPSDSELPAPPGAPTSPGVRPAPGTQPAPGARPEPDVPSDSELPAPPAAPTSPGVRPAPGTQPAPGARPEPVAPSDSELPAPPVAPTSPGVRPAPGTQPAPGVRPEPDAPSDSELPAPPGAPTSPGVRPVPGIQRSSGGQSPPELRLRQGTELQPEPGVPPGRDVQSPPGVRPVQGNQPRPGTDRSPPFADRSVGADQGQGEGSSSDADRDSLRAIGDLLQQQSRRITPADSPSDSPADGLSRKNDSGSADSEFQDSGERPLPSDSGEQEQREQEQREQEQRERVAGQLQEQGFGRTLRNLLEEARREAETAEQQRGQEQTDGQSEQSSSNKSLPETASPQQLINDLMQQIQEEQGRRQQRIDDAGKSDDIPIAPSRPQQSLRWPRPENPPGRDTRGFTDRAFERFQDLVRDLDQGSGRRQPLPVGPQNSGPPVPDSVLSQGAAAADSSTAVSVLEGINWLPLLTAGGVLLFLLLLLPAARILQRRVLSGGGLLSVTPLTVHLVRTREDLVRAFDRWALSCSSAVKPWWNHRQVERELVRRADAAKVTELVQVYEQARYQPADQPLSDVQIATARMLLQECSGVAGRPQ